MNRKLQKSCPTVTCIWYHSVILPKPVQWAAHWQARSVHRRSPDANNAAGRSDANLQTVKQTAQVYAFGWDHCVMAGLQNIRHQLYFELLSIIDNDGINLTLADHICIFHVAILPTFCWQRYHMSCALPVSSNGCLLAIPLQIPSAVASWRTAGGTMTVMCLSTLDLSEHTKRNK